LGPVTSADVPRTVVVTGHFPPEPGGVQTFTWELVRRLPPDRVAVVAPHQSGARAFDRRLPFPVIRRRGYLLTRDLRRIVADAGASAGWIPALAPIGMSVPLVRGREPRCSAGWCGGPVSPGSSPRRAGRSSAGCGSGRPGRRSGAPPAGWTC